MPEKKQISILVLWNKYKPAYSCDCWEDHWKFLLYNNAIFIKVKGNSFLRIIFHIDFLDISSNHKLM